MQLEKGRLSLLIVRDLDGKLPDRQCRFDGPGREVSQLFPVSENGRFYIAIDDGSVWVWNPDHEKPEPLPDSGLRRTPRAMTPDGSCAVSFDSAKTLSLFDLGTNTTLATFTAEAGFTSFALSPDGRLVAAGDDAKRVHILWLVIPDSVHSGKD